MNLARKKYYLALLAAVAGLSALGAATKPSAPAPAPASVFNQPDNPHQGRDPFYPESTRPYATAMAAHAIAPAATLSVRGFSGTAGDRTVIINNHSFAAGDEGDVLTPGGRVHLRCLVIKDNSVIVEANHQRRELSFTTE